MEHILVPIINLFEKKIANREILAVEHPFNSDQFKNWSRFEPDKPENIQGFNVFYLVLVFVYFPNERKNKLQASKIVTFNSYWGIPRRHWFWVIQSIQIVHVDTSSSIRSYIQRRALSTSGRVRWIPATGLALSGYIFNTTHRQLYPHAVEFIFFHISIQDA